MIRRTTTIRGLFFRLSFFLFLCASLTSSYSSYADGTGKWANGEETYRKVCAYCHEAGVGPYLLGRQFPATVIQFMARNGSRAMPAMKPGFIDDVALKNVAEFIEKSAPGPNAPKSSATETPNAEPTSDESTTRDQLPSIAATEPVLSEG